MMQRYPHATVIRWDAFSVVVTWALLVMALAALVASLLLAVPLQRAFGGAFGAFALAALIHAVLALNHKCPVCGKHPTIQGFSPVHPSSVGQSKLAGWAGVVSRVAAGKSFACIHCGTEFALHEPRA